MSEKTPAASGLPLRGLAMVLIAVAVALGLWALYSFTRGGDSEPVAADAPSTVAAQSPQAQQPQPGQTQPGQTQPSAAPGASQPAQSPAPATPAAGEAGAPAASGAGAQGHRKVSVLNNSMVQGLAADASQKVRDAGYELGEVGNFPDEILAETTVFYPAGDAQAESEARALADKFNGVARENIQALPPKATENNSLTIVLVNQ